MQQTMISAEMRDKAGVRAALTAFRAGGRIPAVIYGLDKKPVSVTVDEKGMLSILKTDPNAIITIKYTGGEDTVIIKAIQRHPVSGKCTHFDFYRISLTEKIKVKVHVKIIGECYGVKLQGGLVEHTMRELNVSCLPTEIPHEIVLDITDLHINSSLRVKDIKAGKAELLDAPEQIVVSVTAPKEEKVEEPAAGAAAAGAQPEVIAKGKKEEGEEGAAGKDGAKPAAAGAKPAAGKPEEKKPAPKK
ncbi:MAG TPA: 50S ribosomal protein L25 [Elusimicrobia bacterium]|nr:50S ribosomal protein L25 [Elusimicrobiota bacterium]